MVCLAGVALGFQECWRQSVLGAGRCLLAPVACTGASITTAEQSNAAAGRQKAAAAVSALEHGRHGHQVTSSGDMASGHPWAARQRGRHCPSSTGVHRWTVSASRVVAVAPAPAPAPMQARARAMELLSPARASAAQRLGANNNNNDNKGGDSCHPLSSTRLATLVALDAAAVNSGANGVCSRVKAVGVHAACGN